jgi:hypothetical protein
VIASSEEHHKFKEEEDFRAWRGQGTNFLPREVLISQAQQWLKMLNKSE